MTQGKDGPWELGIEFTFAYSNLTVTSASGVTTTLATPEDTICFSTETILKILQAADKSAPGWTPLPSLADLKNPRAHRRSDCVTPVEILRAMHRALDEVRELHASLLRWTTKKNAGRLRKMLRQTRCTVHDAVAIQQETGGKVECFDQIVQTAMILEQHVELVGRMVEQREKLGKQGGASLVIEPLKRCYQDIFREQPSGGWKKILRNQRA